MNTEENAPHKRVSRQIEAQSRHNHWMPLPEPPTQNEEQL